MYELKCIKKNIKTYHLIVFLWAFRYYRNIAPQTAGSLEDTPLTIVTTLEQLEELKNDLKKVTEFAVDLEVSI